jgi:putative transposase
MRSVSSLAGFARKAHLFVGHGFSRADRLFIVRALAPGGARVAKIARRVRQAGVYFVTTDTWERYALFINTVFAGIVVEQIVSCRDRGFYKLHAFALMPEHLHLLLTPGDDTTVEKAVQMIKGGSAHRIGIERPQQFPIWHRGFHDRWIRDAEQFRNAKSYIEQNPVKANLVEAAREYMWSSANGKVVLDLSRYESASG